MNILCRFEPFKDLTNLVEFVQFKALVNINPEPKD